MKKQINPTIKAHFLRSALIVLPLLAVCVIPFALAQRTYRGKPDELNGSRTQSRVMMPTCRLLVNEGFDDINNLPGWVLINHSEPLGANGWFQGNDGVFPAFDGLSDAYIGANFYNCGGEGYDQHLAINSGSGFAGWRYTDVLHAYNGTVCISGSVAGSDEYQWLEH